MIKAVILDIDGVLTDGCIYVDQHGNETKRVSLKDIDALTQIKKECPIAAVTGEDSPIVDYFQRRFPWDYFYRGVKDKFPIVREIADCLQIEILDICYMGDSIYDLEAIKQTGHGVCPADAIPVVMQAAKVIFKRRGGDGSLWELLNYIQMTNIAE